MKTTITFLFSFAFCCFTYSQAKISETNQTSVKIRCGGTLNQTAEPLYIVDDRPTEPAEISEIDPDKILDVRFLRGATDLFCGGNSVNGVVSIRTANQKTKKCKVKTYPFKVYCIQNSDWVLQQDIYNALEAKVPALRVKNKNAIAQTPSFKIRGEDDTIVIVDGIRFDASILSVLNPNDIETIKVAPSVAATNYFRNGILTN